MPHPRTPLSANDLAILPCAGAGNLGQLSHRAAVELTREGFGKLFCLAGIGAGLEYFIAEIQKAGSLVAVDGCQSSCARLTLERAGIGCKNHLILSDLGIEADDASPEPDPEALQLVRDAIRACCAEAKPIVRLGGCQCGI